MCRRGTSSIKMRIISHQNLLQRRESRMRWIIKELILEMNAVIVLIVDTYLTWNIIVRWSLGRKVVNMIYRRCIYWRRWGSCIVYRWGIERKRIVHLILWLRCTNMSVLQGKKEEQIRIKKSRTESPLSNHRYLHQCLRVWWRSRVREEID